MTYSPSTFFRSSKNTIDFKPKNTSAGCQVNTHLGDSIMISKSI